MSIINIIIYFFLFITGTVIGSFCTLAVYRIPLKKDIIHEHSFCPNCNHKLNVLDLIPVISYLILRGKCRYCGEKIRIRYFLLEILSGIIILLFGISLNLSIEILEISKYCYFIFGILYIITLMLIAGISKEKREIPKEVLLFGVSTMSIYMIYLFIVEKANIDRYIMYLFVMLVLLTIDTFLIKNKQRTSTAISTLLLMQFFLLFTSPRAIVGTAIITLLFIAIGNMKKKKIELPIYFYLCVSNIILLILENFTYYY